MHKSAIRAAVDVAAAIERMNEFRRQRGAAPVWTDEDMARLRALGLTPVVFEGTTEGAPPGEVWVRVTRLDGSLI